MNMRDYEPYYTEDGSIGLYSYADKDVYHSKFGALTEAWEKFVIPSGISSLIDNKQNIKVLDVCYGIGYNTKALMSFIINKNLKQIKNKNLIEKIRYFVSIHTNNFFKKKESELLVYNESIDTNNSLFENLKIDCLDINKELMKLSPFFKTIKTPGEVYDSFVPQIFTCFDSYYKLRKIYENIASIFYPRNKKTIKEKLDIKFKNMHIDKEYKVNGLVNYILINSLSKNFKKNYIDNELKKILKERQISNFLDKSTIRYARFNQFWEYNLSSGNILSTFLHNIYYRYLSSRYKNINFKKAEHLFDVNFYPNDARKTIKKLKETYDCIFLDAFTYTLAPQLWSVEFVNELYEHLNDNGVILTYSNSAQIRNTFLENNLFVGKIYNKKLGKFVGTIASKNKSKIKYPLTNYELGLCNTTAGIPYHDPNLSFSKKEILEFREYEFRHSNLMSSSKYIKIRSMRESNDEI